MLLYAGALSELNSGNIKDYLTRKYLGHALDSDMDGLSDNWEIARFGNLTSTAGGAENSDQDTFTDLKEWIGGTDPKDASSFFSNAIARPSLGVVEVLFNAIPERIYTLETTDD